MVGIVTAFLGSTVSDSVPPPVTLKVRAMYWAFVRVWLPPPPTVNGVAFGAMKTPETLIAPLPAMRYRP